jgi:hypothetical protein
MTAEDFMAESQTLLGTQQYQQLQNLRNRPVQPQPQQPQPVRMQPQNVMADNTDTNGRKRGGFGSENPPQT